MKIRRLFALEKGPVQCDGVFHGGMASMPTARIAIGVGPQDFVAPGGTINAPSASAASGGQPVTTGEAGARRPSTSRR